MPVGWPPVRGSLEKTKYMFAARIRDVGQSVAIGDKQFEIVKEFLYLGSLMTQTNDVSLEIQRMLRWSHHQKTRRPTTKSSEPNPMEEEIKEDRNPGGRMG
jgi:hypothetical protein